MNEQKKTVTTYLVFLSSLKMGLATFLSRILGLIREQVLASYFGASAITDAFLVAYRIPNLLRDLFAEGAFSSAFVPTFAHTREKMGHEGARILMWNLFWVLLMITGGISLLTMIFAPQVLHLFAPSFESDPHKFHITVVLIRWMAPFLTLISLSALFMGALNSLKIFLLPSLTPCLFNGANIFFTTTVTVWFFRWGWEPIYALGVGVLVGGFLQGIVQVPSLVKKHYAPIKVDFKNLFTPEVKKVFIMLGPGLIGFSASQVNMLVNTILATGVMVGAVSWLNYAFRLFQFPVGILSVSLGNSHLVHFSESWKKGTTQGKEEAVSFLKSSYFLSWMLLLPCAIFFYILADQITAMIFERGKFTNFDTQMCGLALRCYMVGLPFYGLYKILVPTFYSLDRQKIPVITSVMSVGLNILFCLIFTPRFGFFILALGTTLSMLFNTVAQGWILSKDLKLGFNFFINFRLIKLLLASVITSATLLLMRSHFSFHGHLLHKILLLGCFFVVTTMVYFLSLWFLGEGKEFKKFLKNRKLA